MNRMETEAKSEECINYDEGQTTVSMKNAASLGKSLRRPKLNGLGSVSRAKLILSWS